MTTNQTFGNLKKRIFDIFDEYTASSDAVYIGGTDKELLESRLPDAVSSSLVRMYESLPIGRKRCAQKITRLENIFCARDVYDSSKGGVEFESVCADVGVFFRYFGKGKVVFSDRDGNEYQSIECDGSGTLSHYRGKLVLEKDAIYIVSVTDSLCIKDFAVYETGPDIDENALCGINEISFELPTDFDKFVSANVFCGGIDLEKIYVCDGYAYVPSDICRESESISLEYRKKPYIITSDTQDDFAFEISPLEYEALICLAASELCREKDAGIYTRLVYKYNDLCEGINTGSAKEIRRNTFYKPTFGRRW